MTLIPNHFLIRLAYPCRYLAKIFREDTDHVLDLPEECILEDFAALDDRRRFAEFRLAWNENGLGLQMQVRGKEALPQASADRPNLSDGLTFWIDTRDARTGHRATRYCHRFHFLPTGGGSANDEPVFGQSKIHRALEDAPLCTAAAVPFRSTHTKDGYRLEAFISAEALNGFDPEQNRRLGFHYVVHDAELGEQYLSVNADFPCAEDPSLWSVLELMR